MVQSLVLSSAVLDRAAGALLGLAVGDALGAGYEFTTPAPDVSIAMIGGGVGGFAPGEWTDDTAQAVGIAEVTATGRVDTLAIGQRFLDWCHDGPKDVGVSTRAVLSGARDPAELPALAAEYHVQHPNAAAGNGSLMRTAAVALAHLGDDDAIAEAATAVSAITHGDPLAGEACVLWCIAIDRAVREARLDGLRDGLALLPWDRADFWRARIDEAETRAPASFTPNGFVVTALQAAHAAIAQTPVPDDGPPCRHLQDALEAAVRIGHDTDTVAAIAGQVLGARWGASAVPAAWRGPLHGWPDSTAADLVRLGVLTARRGVPDELAWPEATTLLPWARNAEPTRVCVEVPGELLGDAGGRLLAGNLPGLPGAVDRGADLVVSLCRVGRRDVPTQRTDGQPVEHLQAWLTDTDGQDDNPNLDFLVADLVATVRDRLAAARTVYVHCAGAHSRTPLLVAALSADLTGKPAAAAWEALRDVLPVEDHNRAFADLLQRLPANGEVPA